MFSFKLAGAIAAILAFSPVGARADLALQATLNNSSEIPATLPTTSFGDPRPASFGTALFLYDWTLPVLSVSLTMTVFNIDVTRSQTADSNDDLITVQLHIGPDVTSTTNGPVAFNLFGPSNDLRPRAAAIMPFATTVGGTITATWDVPFGPAENNWLFHLISGRAYIDVHTAQFQEGEIRGNITADVPEPSTWAMLLIGFAGVSFVTYRRRLTAKKPLLHAKPQRHLLSTWM